MAKTATWQIPYPDLSSPADIQGVDGVDDLALRVDACLSQIRAQGAIPGEVKLWPGGALPPQATYGHWVWADGAVYVTATYPIAAANIATQWRTAHGQADPGAGNFRVPDVRGLAPAGLDQMPGGARANRTTRAVSIVIAGKSGEEYHTITLAESAAHAHALAADSHGHNLYDPQHLHASYGPSGTGASASSGLVADKLASVNTGYSLTNMQVYAGASGVVIANAGGGGAHENVPPTVYVPYIVKLDD